MTSAPAPCVPSDVPAAPRGSAECQTNAARSRQQSNWFAHDHGSAPVHAVHAGGDGPRRTTGTEHSGAATNGSTVQRPESARHAAGLSSLEDRCQTPNSKRTFAKTLHRPGADDAQSWYKYGTDHRDVIIGHSAAPRTPRGINSDGSKVKEKMTACDSNDWFRHEHAPGELVSPRVNSAAGRTPGRKPPASPLACESVNTPLWAGHADVTDGHDDARATPRPEAAEYLRRNKAGTSSDWFPHEHAGGEDAVVHAHKGSKESAENAVRSKGESQTWFAHDPSPTDPRPPPKFSSPEAKALMERACGGEMKQVFRMDQNLKTTWHPPPSNKPRVAAPQATIATIATTDAAAPSEKGATTGAGTDSDRALMDKFLQNQNAAVPPVISNGAHSGGETSEGGKSATIVPESNGEKVD